MGKPKKLKSAIREALQEIISTIKASKGAPLCLQRSKTDSFREAFVSFNSFYFVPPEIASSSSDSTFTWSSRLSSFSEENEEEEASLSVALKSERFFFPPLTSRSIKGESLDQSDDSKSNISEDSVPTAISSKDPYWDFRNSMEEMVMTYGLEDWAALQELFKCYIKLNERRNHRYIVMAFTDLVAQLFSRSGPGSLSSYD